MLKPIRGGMFYGFAILAVGENMLIALSTRLQNLTYKLVDCIEVLCWFSIILVTLQVVPSVSSDDLL